MDLRGGVRGKYYERYMQGTNGQPITAEVQTVLTWLEQQGSQAAREGMARYGLPSDKAFGIAVGTLQREAKRLGRNHELALALWETGWYEARMLAAFVDEPERVTPAQMDRWTREFDNWGICDTVCMHLFDRMPYAWDKVSLWAGRKGEFVKRAAFALVATLALHDKRGPDARFLDGLVLIEQEATDERNFVKKAVNWALRSVGERNAALHTAASAVAERLAESSDATARWVGKDALRKLSSPAVLQRLERKSRR
jgi:3-methyladenine DNA glycosylase AlkD